MFVLCFIFFRLVTLASTVAVVCARSLPFAFFCLLSCALAQVCIVCCLAVTHSRVCGSFMRKAVLFRLFVGFRLFASLRSGAGFIRLFVGSEVTVVFVSVSCDGPSGNC